MSVKPKPIVSSRASKIVMTLYGVTGIGKTRFIGSHEGKTLIVRPPTDHTDSIRDPEGVEDIVVHDWGEMEEAMFYLRDGAAKDYDWVWLDSLSNFQRQGLLDIWDQVIEDKPARARYGPDKQEYGINMNRIMNWLIHMVGTPGFNLGITSHPSEVEGLVRPGEKLLGPWVQGKNMSHNLCAMSNVVAYYALNDKGKRVLRTRLSEDYFAKDEFDALDSGRMFDPTMPKFLTAVNKARPKATPTTRRRRAVRRGGKK